jgi:hypothetical protein
MDWGARSSEERSLLNPSFCAVLLWHGARGHEGETGSSMFPFEMAFLLLPMVLHCETRESLPKSTTTSLAVWLEENPLARSRITDRAQMLVPFVKEALNFGGLHGIFVFANGTIAANADWRKRVKKSLHGCSDEVRLCAKRAEFVGKWFAKTGNAVTVMAIMGVRP